MPELPEVETIRRQLYKKIIGKSFYSFIEKFSPKTGIILTRDYLGEEKIGKTKIKFIPLSYF